MEDKLLSTIDLFRKYGFFNSFIGSSTQIAESIISKSESSYFGNIKDLHDDPLFEQNLLSYDKEICWFIEDANAYFLSEEVEPEMYRSVFTNLKIISKGFFVPENIEIKDCGYCDGRDKRLVVTFSLNGNENELVFCADGWALMLNFVEEINECIQHTNNLFQYIIDGYGACFVYFVSEEQKKFLIEKLAWEFITATDYWADKAMYYKEKGSLISAENCFQKAIKSNNINTFVQYGIFLKEQSKHSEAKAIFEKGKSVLNLQKPPWDNTAWWKDFIQNQIEEIKLITMNLSEVKIGNQTWMTENLEVKKFQNGDNIPFYQTIQDFLKAGRHQEPACCYYDNNPQKGMLYNWFAMNDERGIAPESFKIPNKNDWEELIKYCGGENIAAIHLKSSANWIEPQNAPKPMQIIESEIGNGLDSFGFNALPMGSLVKTNLFAEFFGYGSDANFWTSNTDSFYSGTGFGIYLYYFSPKIIIIPVAKRLGLSIRCVKEKIEN